MLLNTEYQKGKGSKQANPADQAEMDISVDRLVNEIMNLKVRLAVMLWITAHNVPRNYSGCNVLY